MRHKAAAAILFAGTLALLAPRHASAAWSVSISYFHEELAPYGRWVSATAYGDVWCPTVAAGWQPYVYGEWAYTDYGWTWVSYDPFGADPFHYGTWVWIDPYGWCWVPGTVWGPAWVTWAYTDSYIGWACLPPSFEITAAGYSGSPVVVPQTQYVFVPAASFVGTRVSSVRVPVQQNGGILTARSESDAVLGVGRHRASLWPASEPDPTRDRQAAPSHERELAEIEGGDCRSGRNHIRQEAPHRGAGSRARGRSGKGEVLQSECRAALRSFGQEHERSGRQILGHVEKAPAR